MGRADLQLHSDLGDGLSSPAAILDAAERVGLDVIALTDHDDIRGAFALRELAARGDSAVEVVIGVEVTTRSGHLLALWIEDEVPMFCSLADAIARVHGAGGLAVVPHPLSYLTFSVGERTLREIAAPGDPARMVDGIELRNPSYAGRVRARRAEWLNAHVLRVAETGSSDAHPAGPVGAWCSKFPGKTSPQLRPVNRYPAPVPGTRSFTASAHLV